MAWAAYRAADKMAQWVANGVLAAWLCFEATRNAACNVCQCIKYTVTGRWLCPG
tara:strand:- start:131 stop:292 length:162 start_codon:yes stop_codon:yes gene_type:complete